MYLIDKLENHLCDIEEQQIDGSSVTGKVRKSKLPKALNDLLSLYEEAVNNLVFSKLDEIEDEIKSFEILVVIDGKKFKIGNLQLMNYEDISFDIEDYS